jgi:basic amino acid/polyamine antiporter, APA family
VLIGALIKLMSAPPTPARRELPRAIGFIGASAIVVGTIIGSGVFLVPHNIAQHVGSLRALYLVWIVGGILAVAGALSLAELGAAMPEAGGIYIYLRHAYGRLFAFLYGWALLLVINSGSIATLAVAFTIYAGNFLPLSPLDRRLLSSAIIALLALVNILGVRKGAAVQTIFTVAKLAGLGIIVACACLAPHITPLTSSQPLPTPHTSLGPFGIALVGALWAYEGWHMLSFNAGEVKNPSQNLPRSYLLGMLVVVAAYLTANMAYLHVLTLPALAEHQRVASRAMQVLVGPQGATFVSVLILCSIFGALNGNVLGAPRAFFAMSRDGLFFSAVGNVHPRYETPAVAIAIQAAWAIVLAISGTYEQLYTYVICTGWFFYAAATLAVPLLRRKLPDLPRPYKVWGYPVLPIAFTLAALAIVGNTLVRSTRESLLGMGIVLLGIPVFLYWRKFPPRPPNA